MNARTVQLPPQPRRRGYLERLPSGSFRAVVYAGVDALLCAWTAALWLRHGMDRCQVLGPPRHEPNELVATIIGPARPEQRR
jgi:hypothetical protein